MRLVIADDEPLQRYHLRSLVKETAPTIEIVDAANGIELLKILEEGRADFAFVDVRMPKLDGLEAMRRLKSAGVSVPWVVMSSHSEFSYARLALDLGALAYALKPPSAAEVGTLIEKLADALKRDRESRSRAFEHAWAVDGAEGAGFSPISAGLLVVDDVAALAACGGLRALRQRLAERFQTATPGELTAIVPGSLPGSLEIAHMGCQGFWAEAYAAAPGGRSVCIVAEVADSPQEARARLHSLRTIASYRALLPPGVIGTRAAAELMAAFSSVELKGAEAAGRVVSAAATKESVSFRDAAVDLAAASAELDDSIRSRVLRFLDRALAFPFSGETWDEALKRLRGGSPSEFRSGDPDEDIRAASEPEEAGDAIASVERYLRRHFADRVSLAGIAELFSLTPNYLSALFHQRMGVTFVEFVTALRLERARELLKGGKSVKETAWAVGYGNERHFAQLYRKRFALPPAAEKNAKS